MYIMSTASILKFMAYNTQIDFEFFSSGELMWYHADPKPTEQDILDNELGWSKSEAEKRIKLVGSAKIANIYPFIDSSSKEAIGLYTFAYDLYTSIAPAARLALSGNLLELKGIFDSAVDAIADINAMTDVTLVQNYDAVNTPSWP